MMFIISDKTWMYDSTETSGGNMKIEHASAAAKDPRANFGNCLAVGANCVVTLL